MNQTKYVSLVILIFLCTFANCYANSSNSTNLTKVNFDWYIRNSNNINQVLREGSLDEFLPVINMLGLIWKHQDGAIGVEVSPKIAEAFINKPELMFCWFKKNPDDFRYFIERLPFDLFTDYSGERMLEVQCLRSRLIQSLTKFLKDNPPVEYFEMGNVLLKKIEMTKVRQPD